MLVHWASTFAFVCITVAACLLSSGPGCARGERALSSGELPQHSVEWHTGEEGLVDWGSGGAYLYGVSLKPSRVTIWKWKDSTVERYGDWATHDAVLHSAVPSDTAFLSYDFNDQSKCTYFRLQNLQTGEVLRRWDKPESDLYYRISSTSRNGKHVAVWATRDMSLPGYDFQTAHVRVGTFTSDFEHVNWCATLTGPVGEETIGQVIPSDDGAYVALAGWQHGAAVVDMNNKRVLWESRPPSATCFRAIAFSPDSKLVYAGGGEGCVYGMDSATGEVVNRWFTTLSNQSEGVRRVSTISVSPDGRLVAVGTGPDGQVFVFEAKTGVRVRTFNHGGSTILITSFSPDSGYLATFAAGTINVWKLP